MTDLATIHYPMERSTAVRSGVPATCSQSCIARRRFLATGLLCFFSYGCSWRGNQTWSEINAIQAPRIARAHNELGAISLVRSLWSSAELDFRSNPFAHIEHRLSPTTRARMSDTLYSIHNDVLRTNRPKLGIYAVVPPTYRDHSTVLHYKVFDPSAIVVASGLLNFTPQFFDDYYFVTVDQISTVDDCGFAKTFFAPYYSVGIEPIEGYYYNIWDTTVVNDRWYMSRSET